MRDYKNLSTGAQMLKNLKAVKLPEASLYFTPLLCT